MRLTTKQRIRIALKDGSLTSAEILERVGIDCIAALRQMQKDGQVVQEKDTFRLVS